MLYGWRMWRGRCQMSSRRETANDIKLACHKLNDIMCVIYRQISESEALFHGIACTWRSSTCRVISKRGNIAHLINIRRYFSILIAISQAAAWLLVNMKRRWRRSQYVVATCAYSMMRGNLPSAAVRRVYAMPAHHHHAMVSSNN